MIPRTQFRRLGVAIFSIFFALEFATPLYAFGPFPAGATVFVDVNNATSNEDGSQAHPFNTIQEGISAAGNGGMVGVAAGAYYDPSLSQPEEVWSESIRKPQLSMEAMIPVMSCALSTSPTSEYQDSRFAARLPVDTSPVVQEFS